MSGDRFAEAARETLCDDESCGRCAHLSAALAAFDQEGTDG